MDATHRKNEDSAWKDILAHRFREFLAFFFPRIHSDIDWGQKLEFLDKELEQVLPQSLVGRRFADKLVKVQRRSGTPLWVVVHVEIQGTAQQHFAKRMFIYNYRVFDRHVGSRSGTGEVVSLVVFTGKETSPRHYKRELWGFRNLFSFPAVSLEGFRGREKELESDPNPFAIVVLAHLKLNEARSAVERKHWKLELVRQLLARNYSREDIMELLRFLDWVLVLPPDLEKAFRTEIVRLEKGKAMPYVTSFERKAMQEGIEQGVEKGMEKGRKAELLEAIGTGLDLRFGPAGRELLDAIRKLEGLDKLREFHRVLLTAESIEDLKRALPNG